MFFQALAFATVLSVVASSAPNRPEGPTTAKVKPATVDDMGEIGGYYTCKGVEVGGKTYTGVCVISKKGEVYLVSWMIGTGSTFTGLGIRQGNTLAVSWALPGDRGMVRGVNLYTIQSGGRLSGRWATLPGPGMLQSETLSFLKALDDED